MQATLTSFSPHVLAILRIVTALIFIAHGTQKLFGFPVAGPPSLNTLQLIGALLEVFGGLAILLGAFTRPVAFVLSGEMAVAYWMFHAPRNFYPVANGGDAAILYCFIFLFLVFSGPGSFALDNLFGRERAREPVTA